MFAVEIFAVTGLFNRAISETDQGFAGWGIPWTLAGLRVTGGGPLTALLWYSFRLTGVESTDLDGMHTMAYC